MNESELKKVNGGVVKLALGKIGILGGAIIFLVGIVDGFINPSKCNRN